ncbi:ATP-binding protein [Nocardiopsis changdeensis]|uniref:ATP-binding protein n=1 Tax=Nocardiopsis changdeensis TaxID=2831969 RepID=UPI003F4699BF
MRVGVLGPVRADGLAVGGARARALLARLALEAGRPLTHGALIGALWTAAPEHPEAALHSSVSRLRRALPDPSVLRSVPAGYLLDVPADAVDALLFERLVREGREELRRGRPAAAAGRLDRALGLWRGEPLADAGDPPYAAAVVQRWTGLRLDAREDRAGAALALPGADPAALAAELEELAAARPLREGPLALLIEVLADDGRTPEALAAYEAHRARLAEELGVDPGPRVRRAHLRALRGEPARSVPGEPPAPLTSFVGREADLARLRERLAGHRLVTLTGPGGVGKSRLAAEAARTASGVRVRTVSLTPVAAGQDVPHAAARALGLRPSRSPVETLADALGTAETLLVLDGCEHVVDAAARLAADLAARCPGLRILATGREPLGVAGEARLPVPPLAPEAAGRLFTDRARTADPDFSPTEEAAAVWRALDGLPLAIELAAARLGSMPLADLAAQMTDRLAVLTGGDRTAPPHQRTLRGVIAWSWDLLAPAEREAAELLSVFAAPFTAGAAAGLGVPAPTLYALVDRSLLDSAGGRYRMLDTVREFGRERLAAAGRLEGARAAHAAALLAVAEGLGAGLRGPGQREGAAALAADLDDLVAALAWAYESGDTGTAERLGSVLGLFWLVRDEHAAAARLLRPTGPRTCALYLLNVLFAGESAAGAVSAPGAGSPEGAVATALLALADGSVADAGAALAPHLDAPDPWERGLVRQVSSFLQGAAGNAAGVRADLERALAGFAEAGDPWWTATASLSLAAACSAAGALEEARGHLARARGLGVGEQVWRAMMAVDAGDPETARAELREAAAGGGSARRAARARVCLADLERHDGDLAAAGELLDSCSHLARDSRAPDRILYATAAGFLEVARGAADAAAPRLAEAFDLVVSMADPPMLAHVGVGVADLLLLAGAPERAARVLGAARVVRGGPGDGHPDVVRVTRALAGHLPRIEAGAALAPEAALALLRRERAALTPGPPPSPPPR